MIRIPTGDKDIVQFWRQILAIKKEYKQKKKMKWKEKERDEDRKIDKIFWVLILGKLKGFLSKQKTGRFLDYLSR